MSRDVTILLARRLLTQEKARFAITVGGMAAMIVLVLFLFGVYAGVARGATEYVRTSAADIWVSAKNSTNLLRSSSFLRASSIRDLKQIHGVREVSCVLRLIAAAEVNGELVTLFVFGFEPGSPLARPATVAGSSRLDSGEIILDRAFAARHGLRIGDPVYVQDRRFTITGLSAGTNALVAQFSFVTLEDAQRLLGLADVVSFGVLTLASDASSGEILRSVSRRDARLVAFEKTVFVDNNLKEMETGILPVLWTIALFGALTGTAVLALLLYSAVQEQREDYAVLSAVGAPHGCLRSVVVQQSVLSGTAGFGVGLALYAACVPLLRRAVPELELVLTMEAVVATFVAAMIVSLAGSFAALRKLRSIYPAEVLQP